MKTPEEIIKALRRCCFDTCVDDDGQDKCPFYEHGNAKCMGKLHIAAADCLEWIIKSDAFQDFIGNHPSNEDKPPEDDPVNHPSHYTQGGIECIDAIKAATTGLVGFEGYCTGNIIKYLWRWKHKNGLEDLRKAGWYLGALIGSKEG